MDHPIRLMSTAIQIGMFWIKQILWSIHWEHMLAVHTHSNINLTNRHNILTSNLHFNLCPKCVELMIMWFDCQTDPTELLASCLNGSKNWKLKTMKRKHEACDQSKLCFIHFSVGFKWNVINTSDTQAIL